MDGVEILNTVESIPRLYVFCIILLGILILAGSVIAILGCTSREPVAFLIGFVTVVCFGFTLFTAIKSSPPNNIQYEVVVSDKVGMNEFFDKYTIIERHGEIYTVKEKDKDD